MKKDKINKMRELKDYLEAKGEKVDNIKYIGKISKTKEKEEIENNEEDIKKAYTEKEIYRCEEKIKGKNGEEICIVKYYTEDFECIAIENEINGIIPTEKYQEEREVIDQLQELDEKGILDLEEENLKETIEIAKTLGIDKEDINNISEIELENLEKAEKGMDENNKIKAKEIATMDANEKITTRDSMATMLGVEGKGYEKIAVVNSKDLNNKNATTQFSFVGIKANGEKEKIDSVEAIHGTTPFRTISAISPDGEDIKEEQSLSMYRVKWREDEEISISIDELNTIKVSLVRTSPETNKPISIPIETNTIAQTSYEDKDFMNSIKNPKVTAETKRIEEEQKEGNEPNLKNIEDNTTYNYKEENEEYIPNTNIKWTDFAAKCGYRGEGAVEKAKEEFEKAKEKNNVDSNEEIAENVVEQKEEEYSRERKLEQ